MNNKKIALAFLVFAFVLSCLTKVLSLKWLVIGWAVLGLAFFLWLLMLAADIQNPWKKYPAMMLACLGILMSLEPMIQLINGNLEGDKYIVGAPIFQQVDSMDDLEELAIQAKKTNKPLILWFTQKGGNTDLKFRTETFDNVYIRETLNKSALASIDITEISESEQIIIDRLQVKSFPTMICWDGYGKLLPARITSEMSTAEFAQFLLDNSLAK